MTKHEFLWLDLETTGLDPRLPHSHILEWAVVLAADDIDGDMSVVEQFTGVIDPWGDEKQFARDLEAMDPFVRKMHTDNGLFDAVMKEGGALAEAEDFLVALCQGLSESPEPKGIILAGATVHFDLDWIRVHMPRFAKCLSHRVFDVSTLKNANRAWLGDAFKKAEAHRALPDIIESLEHAKAFRDRHSDFARATLTAQGLSA